MPRVFSFGEPAEDDDEQDIILSVGYINRVLKTELLPADFIEREEQLQRLLEFCEFIADKGELDWEQYLRTHKTVESFISNIYLTDGIKAYDKIINRNDKANHIVFLAIEALLLCLLLLRIMTIDPGAGVTSLINVWGGVAIGNQVDITCGFIAAIALWNNGDQALGATVFSAAWVDLITTCIAVLTLTDVAVMVSESAALGLIGFAVPMMMCVSAVIEQGEINKLKSKLKDAEEILATNPRDANIQKNLRFSILQYKAQLSEHEKSRNAWLIAAGVMFVCTAVVLFAFPPTTPVVAMAAIFTLTVTVGLGRFKFIDKNKNVDNVKSLSTDTLKTWFDLNAIVYDYHRLHDSTKMSERTILFFEKNQQTIEKLLYTCPESAKEILGAFEKLIDAKGDSLGHTGKFQISDAEILKKYFKEDAPIIDSLISKEVELVDLSDTSCLSESFSRGT
jgi:hypothetical protein